jgi:4-hydroxybenzoate polyprenyltransferase
VEYFSYDSSQPLGGLSLLVWTGLYVLLNLLYSFYLKQHPVVDVLAVAMGFVLRAMAGAAAISVPISPWLVVCTLTLCLFIAIAKRRGEILEVPSDQIGQARPANLGYTPALLEHMMTVSATLAILTYSLYCLAPRTLQHVGSAHMIWTIPLVIYGMFRYYRIATLSQQSDPVGLLIRDKVMWMVLGLYVILSGLVLNYGSMAGIRDILDA